MKQMQKEVFRQVLYSMAQGFSFLCFVSMELRLALAQGKRPSVGLSRFSERCWGVLVDVSVTGSIVVNGNHGFVLVLWDVMGRRRWMHSGAAGCKRRRLIGAQTAERLKHAQTTDVTTPNLGHPEDAQTRRFPVSCEPLPT